MGTETEFDDEYPTPRMSVNANNSANGSQGVVIQLDAAKAEKYILSLTRAERVAALAIIGLAVAAFFAYNSQRETRMLEYYVMELDGKVMQAGIIKPDESWSGRKLKEEKEP